MAESDFSFNLYRRKDSRSPNYYASITRNGIRTDRSTGTTSKAEALRTIATWLADDTVPDPANPGRPESITTHLDYRALRNQLRDMPLSPAEGKELAGILSERFPPVPEKMPGDELLIDFLERFWNYDTSPYVREKHVHGQKIAKRHCDESLRRVKYWKTAFLGLKLSELTKIMARDFLVGLRGTLAPATVNAAMLVCSTALGWAKDSGILAENPLDGLMRFSGEHKERGILELDEIHNLLNVATWEDERARVATLVAVTTGLRQSEIRAIQLRDIEGGTLHVFGWKEAEGQRGTPKNGESRTVPLLPEVEAEIRKLAASNPHGNELNYYIFWGSSGTMPIRPEPLIHGLELALGTIGIDRATRLERGIDFHSLRHTFTTHISRSVEASALQSVTGHRTASTFRLYSGHKTLKDLVAVRSAVSSILVGKVDEDSLRSAGA